MFYLTQTLQFAQFSKIEKLVSSQNSRVNYVNDNYSVKCHLHNWLDYLMNFGYLTIFFSTGLAAVWAPKQKSCTTKSPLQDWVFRQGFWYLLTFRNTYQGRLVGLGSTGSQQQSLLSHCACEVPNLPQSILSLSETAHLSWGVVGPLGVVVFTVVVPEVVGSLQVNSFQSRFFSIIIGT